MRMTHVLLIVSFFVFMTVSNGQFFTKIGSNSIPRMGRRSDTKTNISNLVRRVARTLRFVIEMVEKYDEDGNGELNPEELMDVPLVQNAVKSYMEEQELRDSFQSFDDSSKFRITEAEERTRPKRPYDQPLIM